MKSMVQQRTQLTSRAIAGAIVTLALGSLFLRPVGALAWTFDILLRTYLMFLGTVMAHEATHGHMGASKRANFWWGRLALIPVLVPYVNFRKTHQLHHAHTNEPGLDPDHFLKTRRAWEIPLRALAMPHQWLFWLKARGRIKRADAVELALHYVGIVAIYGSLGITAGASRVLLGVGPALVLVSLLLWYPFAIKTHEGFSTGSDEARSHAYYGHFMYWFSLGLSAHRAHHQRPQLTWWELRREVRQAPGNFWQRLVPRRDVRHDLVA